MTKTWLITGASSGLRRAMTERLLGRGDRVVATVRHEQGFDALSGKFGGHYRYETTCSPQLALRLPSQSASQSRARKRCATPDKAETCGVAWFIPGLLASRGRCRAL